MSEDPRAAEELSRVVAEARGRLNALILCARGLRWAAPAAFASALLLGSAARLGLGADVLFNEGTVWLLWAGIVAIASLAGAALAWPERMDQAAAARWLDSRLEDGELLSAALCCVERGEVGAFDLSIVEAARAIAPKASTLRASPLPLAKRLAMAIAACLLGIGSMVLLGSEAAAKGAAATASSKGMAGARAREGARAEAGMSRLEASAFASSLFPQDKRLATLAERALREGRTDDLRNLLKAADLDFENRLSRPLSDLERQTLNQERERIQDAAAALDSGSPSRGRAGGQARRGERGSRAEEGDPSEQGGFSRAAPDSGGRREAGPGGASGGAAQGGNAESEDEAERLSPSPDSSREAGMGFGAGRGGGSYGSGPGAEGDWGPIAPAASGQKAPLPSRKDEALFELVLPGRDATAPIAQIAGPAARSAESAMSRQSVPLEYEDFVRSYFMQLTKGDAR